MGTHAAREVSTKYRYLKILRQPCAGRADQILLQHSCEPRREIRTWPETTIAAGLGPVIIT